MSETNRPETESRSWLILSLKWSGGDAGQCVWYRTACSGYTTDLMYAGRYTEAEAKENQLDKVTLAVPLAVAYSMARPVVGVPFTPDSVAVMREAK
jgi:hypothetical protein